jgi:Calponin homology (CH) domain
MMKIENLETDLSDGVLLCALLELISSKKLIGINQKAKIRVQKLENNGAALRFLKSENIKLVAIGPEGTLSTRSGRGVLVTNLR